MAEYSYYVQCSPAPSLSAIAAYTELVAAASRRMTHGTAATSTSSRRSSRRPRGAARMFHHPPVAAASRETRRSRGMPMVAAAASTRERTGRPGGGRGERRVNESDENYLHSDLTPLLQNVTGRRKTGGLCYGLKVKFFCAIFWYQVFSCAIDRIFSLKNYPLQGC